MNLDRQIPASIFVDDGLSDNPLLANLNRKRAEIKLLPEPWLSRAIRIGVVSIIAFWVVWGVAIFIMR
jgi:hypothetical protein